MPIIKKYSTFASAEKFLTKTGFKLKKKIKYLSSVVNLITFEKKNRVYVAIVIRLKKNLYEVMITKKSKSKI